VGPKLRDGLGNSRTPDFAVIYDVDKGLLFEQKSSLPSDSELARQEVQEIGRYSSTLYGWPTSDGSVQHHDIVLICHMADVKGVVDLVKELSQERGNEYLRSNGFSVWSWAISPPKQAGGEDQMRFFREYGRTRNEELEKILSEPGAILVPEDVLTVYRFRYLFTRERPPVQYTMVVLIQHVFNSFARSLSERGQRRLSLQLIQDRTSSYFPHWWGAGVDASQARKEWVEEALHKMVELGLIETVEDDKDIFLVQIPPPRFRGGTLEDVICKKLSRAHVAPRTRSLKNFLC